MLVIQLISDSSELFLDRAKVILECRFEHCVTMVDVIELNRLLYQLGVRIKTLHEVLPLSVRHHMQSGDLYRARRTARLLRKTDPINSLFRGVRVFTPSSSRCKRGSYPSQLRQGDASRYKSLQAGQLGTP